MDNAIAKYFFLAGIMLIVSDETVILKCRYSLKSMETLQGLWELPVCSMCSNPTEGLWKV